MIFRHIPEKLANLNARWTGLLVDDWYPFVNLILIELGRYQKLFHKMHAQGWNMQHFSERSTCIFTNHWECYAVFILYMLIFGIVIVVLRQSVNPEVIYVILYFFHLLREFLSILKKLFNWEEWIFALFWFLLGKLFLIIFGLLFRLWPWWFLFFDRLDLLLHWDSLHSKSFW